eukprot:CAMPEP_0197032950 /NCGR_PEP_ID=MMETSP1384-20130603/11483_1 /TAXON_ID=29189 /ORGANISM="Ammonia sp." /LENGTH=131 /DNA_ID=CAMNT_0042462681 /DNA_START=53 /DNA_END=445 /DNA_ORIENTATION=+
MASSTLSLFAQIVLNKFYEHFAWKEKEQRLAQAQLLKKLDAQKHGKQKYLEENEQLNRKLADSIQTQQRLKATFDEYQSQNENLKTQNKEMQQQLNTLREQLKEYEQIKAEHQSMKTNLAKSLQQIDGYKQ